MIRRPTKLQTALAALLISEPSISLRAAMLKVGYSQLTADRHGAETARQPGTRLALEEQLAAAGITPEKVLERLAEGLNYKRSKWFKDTHLADEVDNANRLAAVEMCARLFGWVRDQSTVQVVVQIVGVLESAGKRFVKPEDMDAYMGFVQEGIGGNRTRN